MKRILTLLALSIFLAGPTFAASERDTKAALINEYFSYIPMKAMMADMAQEMSRQLPAEKRQQFIDVMTKRVRVEVLENAARQSLAKHLTVGELRLFVDFIKQPEARSAMGTTRERPPLPALTASVPRATSRSNIPSAASSAARMAVE